MGRFSTFLLGLATGAALFYGASNYHVVRANDGLHTIPKLTQTLAGAYVDIRNFGPDDWLNRPALATAIQQDGKPELLQQALGNAVQEQLENLLPPAAQ